MHLRKSASVGAATATLSGEAACSSTNFISGKIKNRTPRALEGVPDQAPTTRLSRGARGNAEIFQSSRIAAHSLTARTVRIFQASITVTGSIEKPFNYSSFSSS